MQKVRIRVTGISLDAEILLARRTLHSGQISSVKDEASSKGKVLSYSGARVTDVSAWFRSVRFDKLRTLDGGDGYESQ